jgi:hypothetical protein
LIEGTAAFEVATRRAAWADVLAFPAGQDLEVTAAEARSVRLKAGAVAAGGAERAGARDGGIVAVLNFSVAIE